MHRRLLVPLFMLSACAAQPAATPSTVPACPDPAPVTVPSPPERREGFIVDETWPDVLDRAAFERLLTRAAEEHSTALLLIHDGKLIHASNPSGEDDLDRASFAMSASKSVVALLIGKLVDQGVLKLDEPLSVNLVPEWKDDDRSTITLRHLLNHTSGLDPQRARARAYEGEKKVRRYDIEKTAFDAKLVTPVGTKFAYNNQAVDFLSVIVKRLYSDGVRLDDMLDKLILGPLGVHGAYWSKDDNGDPGAGGELLIRPIDLAKIGQLVLDGGRWQGEPILTEAWMKQMLSAGQPHYDGCGLLWWLDGPKREDGSREVLSYRADGYLGQYVIVVPDKRLVAVRMRDPNRTSWSPDEGSYKNFYQHVLAVAGHAL